MDLRYPAGPFRRPVNWTDSDRAAAIGTIAALPEALRSAVAGLSALQLDSPYRPGAWTMRQVVHHLADSHMNAFVRMRCAVTEDNPTIKAYDQDAWASLTDSVTMDVGVSLDLLQALHARWVVFLRGLAPADFSRPFQHPESGPQTLDTTVALYAWHSRHHTAQITSLRERNGWK